MYESLTTEDKKFGLIMHLIEKTLLTTDKLEPFFWSKKECKKLNLDIYRRYQVLYQIFGAIQKNFSEEILLNTFKSFKPTQIKKISQLSRWRNNIGKIIATIQFYCLNEELRIKRISTKKDEDLSVSKIVFEPGADLRTEKPTKKKSNLWSLIAKEK